jgi:hypothetical protein
METVILYPVVCIVVLVITHIFQFSRGTPHHTASSSTERAVKLFHYRQVCQIDNSLADKVKIDKGV